MLCPGVYPAAVTPMKAGEFDPASVAKLLAWYEAAGCRGVVLAGTNGEGPSLSAVEKRDLVRLAVPLAGKLDVILGIATPSLPEATWLAGQASKSGAAGLLVMPPAYFRTASESGIEDWLTTLASTSPIPILVYNFPRMTGWTFSAESLARLARHPNIVGAKDSSGEASNLAMYRQAMGPDATLFVGDETLLIDALAAGWQGTISGAANVVPSYLARIVDEEDQRAALFELALPVIQALRSHPQPAMNKAVLAALGLINERDVRLPLTPVDPQPVLDVLRARLGIRPGVPLS